MSCKELEKWAVTMQQKKFKAVRETLAKYFMTPLGQMQHQFDYVKRGSF